MSGSPNSPENPGRSDERVEQAVYYFEQACNGSAAHKVKVQIFLPPPGDPARLPTLLRLIPLDLKRRGALGQTINIEDYAAEFPELGSSADLPVELIACEYRARAEFETRPCLDDYQQRFPAQFAQLQELISPALEPRETLFAPAAESTGLGEDENHTVSRETPSPLMDTNAPLDPGTTIGEGQFRLTLIRLLGEGQYGQVWLAMAPGDVQKAVKIIRFPRGHQMTQQELRSLDLIKGLRHPFLLPVHAYWFEGEQLIIVTDLADMTLDDRLQQCLAEGHTGIPRDELVGYVSDAADAIDFLHERDVIHRDVKPANILVVDKRARVGDFGLARVMEHRSDLSQMQATVLGTPLYMPPEAYDAKACEQSDQYSLAISFLELRTGRAPFKGTTQAQVIKQILKDGPDLGGLEEREAHVLAKALAKKPSDRYPNCREFASALVVATQPPKYRLLKRILQAACLIAVAVAAWTLWNQATSYTLTVERVTVDAGFTEKFSISVERGILAPPADIIAAADFRYVPKGVQFTPIPSEYGAEVTVDDVNHETTNVTVALDLKVGGEVRKTTTFELDIKRKKPAFELPFGFSAADDTLQKCENHKVYYKMITKNVSGCDEPVRFLLVDCEHPFYIMETKVWNNLFDAFANNKDEDAAPRLDEDSVWTQGTMLADGEYAGVKKHPMWPVFSVSFFEAERFAKWLAGNEDNEDNKDNKDNKDDDADKKWDGRLPSAREWDTALDWQRSNYTDRWGSEDEKTNEQIAVNRAQEGPLDVRTAPLDETNSGIRDMYGNGFEWTRDKDGENIVLRGMAYDKKRPYTPDDAKWSNPKIDRIEKGKIIPYRDDKVSFRVVLVPPESEAAPTQHVVTK